MIFPEVKCIKCYRYRLTYWDKLKLLPFGAQMPLKSFTCPKCSFKQGNTNRSSLKFTLWLFSPWIVYFGAATDLLESQLWFFLYLACMFLIWPRFVQLREWKSWDEAYYLPENRLIGYFIYLILPVAYVIFLFGLGKLLFGP